MSVEGAIEGIYATFTSFPGIELALESLDSRQRRGPELMSVQEVDVGGGLVVERATVFIPQGKISSFVGRVTKYLETADQDRPRNQNLVDRIESVRAASIEALWTDPPHEFPAGGELVWWEVWLRHRDGQELARLKAFADAMGLRVGRESLGFGERTVVLVEATVEQLGAAIDVLDDLAELRKPRDVATFLADQDAAEQAGWVDDLANRTEHAQDGAPAVCVVDTGVYYNHPLLKASLDAADCHAADPTWSVNDHDGHGTKMAGLALYGDLGRAFGSSATVRLRHRLESVKLLPPLPRQNPPELFGAVTAAGISQVEIQAPERRRVYSVAVTTRWGTQPEARADLVFGQPSAWSAALDALAAGRGIDVTDEGLVFLGEAEDAARRLFLLSAGNVSRLEQDHLTRSDVEPIEDPAQAWNVLTVGAFTDLDDMAHAPASFKGWTPLAPRGELSPHSRTSVPFGKTWPVKPDVVLEGGNVARSPENHDLDTPPNLQVLTTKKPQLGGPLLTTVNATSAATAQAAALAASIMAEYPALWPETVRALLVHSAEWTPAMRAQFSKDNKKGARIALRRRYGMGVPDLARATRSATDALTLIVEDVIHPFDDGKMREIHLHDLPWPRDILEELGEVQARLRVTLSYFIEPNPGRRGWQRRYSYASHGLRFDIRRPTESNDDFQKRINQKARAEEEYRSAPSTDNGWFFGTDHQRAAGSLHTDIWTGNAADLALRGALVVFPVTGWWKENPARDHSSSGARYALIVSVETPEQDVDIWTPIAQQIGVPIATTVTIST